MKYEQRNLVFFKFYDSNFLHPGLCSKPTSEIVDFARLAAVSSGRVSRMSQLSPLTCGTETWVRPNVLTDFQRLTCRKFCEYEPLFQFIPVNWRVLVYNKRIRRFWMYCPELTAASLATIHFRRPWTRAFFRPASRTVGFSLRFKNSGHVMIFLWLCGLQNTDHVMPFWLFPPVAAKEKTASWRDVENKDRSKLYPRKS